MFLFAFSPAVATPAGAHTTVNQTTCAPTAPNNCFTGGVLQDLAVNCANPGVEGQVATWLSKITDRNGPNRITVSGTCNQNVGIIGFNRLTIAGAPGALIRNMFVSNSRLITLQSLNLGQNTGSALTMNASSVTLDDMTITNAGGYGVTLTYQSALFFAGTPSVIANNNFSGIRAAGGSQVTLAKVTINNNGTGNVQGTNEKCGVVIVSGSSLILSNKLPNNTDAPVNIFANPRAGIFIGGGTMEMGVYSPTAAIRIHDNGESGLAVEDGHAGLAGSSIKLDGNGNGGTQASVLKGVLEVGGGVQIEGNVDVVLDAALAVGDSEGGDGPMTITGTVNLEGVSLASLQNANTIGALTCDGTSWVVSDGQSSIGSTTCSGAGPAVTVTAGTGLSGGGTVALGDAITLNNTGVLSVSRTSPVVSSGGQNPTLSLTPNYFIQNGTSAQIRRVVQRGGQWHRGWVGGALSAAANSFNVAVNGAVTIGNGTPLKQYASSTFGLNGPR